jgi:FKBP-type peptidyl-prolyl cis-trans isomerase
VQLKNHRLSQRYVEDMKSGIELISEIEGNGILLKQGDFATYEIEILLHHGQLISKDEITSQINRNNLIPGLVQTLVGMRENGHREVKISPHLAYGKNGVKNLIPPNALLHCKIWLKNIAT